jgi:hypothetical protein
MFFPVTEGIARLVSELHPFFAGLAQHFIRSNFFGARVPFEVSLALRLTLVPPRRLGCRLNGRYDIVIAITAIRNSLFLIESLCGHPSRRYIRRNSGNRELNAYCLLV